jgi:hypothetical protein
MSNIPRKTVTGNKPAAMKGARGARIRRKGNFMYYLDKLRVVTELPGVALGENGYTGTVTELAKLRLSYSLNDGSLQL